ncbi:MAG: site-specific integrase [Clostridia bacterium]|nr:site-specific integrase [Clostridia bacterium]
MAVKTNSEINGNKYYRVRRVIGHAADGSPILKNFYGKGMNEANEKADKYIQDLKLGLQTSKGVITISSLFSKWLFNNKKNSIKRSTFESYEGLYRNYIETDIISNRPINELKSVHIQQYYERLKKKNAVHSKKKVSSKRIKAIHKLLHLFFVYAEKEGYILRNPCNNVTIPKEEISADEVLKNKMKFDYFTKEEIQIILKEFEGSSYKDIVVFALATGMRQGEILGLQWSDLDFKNRTISVLHNLTNSADFDEKHKRTYSLRISTPKSHNSIRTIPMNDTVYNMLINKERTNTMVFPSKQNTYICNKNLLKVWQRKLKNANIRYRKFHDLRHTFATLMLANGCDLITLKELMGHSSIKITEIYLEAIPENKSDSIKKMDFIIN